MKYLKSYIKNKLINKTDVRNKSCEMAAETLIVTALLQFDVKVPNRQPEKTGIKEPCVIYHPALKIILLDWIILGSF